MSITKSRARRLAQTQTKNFKSNIIEDGHVLTVISYEERNTEATASSPSVPNDFLLCVDNNTGKNIKLPVREFNKLIPSGDNKLVRVQEGDTELYPATITIESSKPRLDRNDKPFYPAYAYKGSDEFYESLGTDSAMSFEDLVATELKEDNSTDPVQDYTVSTSF